MLFPAENTSAPYRQNRLEFEGDSPQRLRERKGQNGFEFGIGLMAALERRTANGERRMANGERRTANEHDEEDDLFKIREARAENSEPRTPKCGSAAPWSLDICRGQARSVGAKSL